MTTQDPASAAAPIQGVEYRYRLYELDAQSRSSIKHIWPIIAPDLDKAVDAILAVAAQLPHLHETIGKNGAVIKKLEMAHLEALLNGDVDDRYFESLPQNRRTRGELRHRRAFSQHRGKLSVARRHGRSGAEILVLAQQAYRRH